MQVKKYLATFFLAFTPFIPTLKKLCTASSQCFYLCLSVFESFRFKTCIKPFGFPSTIV